METTEEVQTSSIHGGDGISVTKGFIGVAMIGVVGVVVVGEVVVVVVVEIVPKTELFGMNVEGGVVGGEFILTVGAVKAGRVAKAEAGMPLMLLAANGLLLSVVV